MTDPGTPRRRAHRRRHRARSAADPSLATGAAAPAAGASTVKQAGKQPGQQTVQPAGSARTKARKASAKSGQGGRRDRGAGDSPDRGLRDLIGAGPSQIGVSRSARARDINRPSDDDIAAAEADLVIVRRNWRPQD